MIREFLGVDCSEEEERIAAACVLLQTAAEDIALNPEIKRGVVLALRALLELPIVWRREMAFEALSIEPWRISA